MMWGVMRTEGMRPFCARRRTVVSLTCKMAASCRAVKNSSRDLGDGGVASSIKNHPAPALFRRTLNRESDAIAHRAVNLHIFRLSLCALAPDRKAIHGPVSRESKNSLPAFIGPPPVTLFRRPPEIEPRQFNTNAGNAQAVFVKDAAPEFGN